MLRDSMLVLLGWSWLVIVWMLMGRWRRSRRQRWQQSLPAILERTGVLRKDGHEV